MTAGADEIKLKRPNPLRPTSSPAALGTHIKSEIGKTALNIGGPEVQRPSCTPDKFITTATKTQNFIQRGADNDTKSPHPMSQNSSPSTRFIRETGENTLKTGRPELNKTASAPTKVSIAQNANQHEAETAMDMDTTTNNRPHLRSHNILPVISNTHTKLDVANSTIELHSTDDGKHIRKDTSNSQIGDPIPVPGSNSTLWDHSILLQVLKEIPELLNDYREPANNSNLHDAVKHISTPVEGVHDRKSSWKSKIGNAAHHIKHGFNNGIKTIRQIASILHDYHFIDEQHHLDTDKGAHKLDATELDKMLKNLVNLHNQGTLASSQTGGHHLDTDNGAPKLDATELEKILKNLVNPNNQGTLVSSQTSRHHLDTDNGAHKSDATEFDKILKNLVVPQPHNQGKPVSQTGGTEGFQVPNGPGIKIAYHFHAPVTSNVKIANWQRMVDRAPSKTSNFLKYGVEAYKTYMHYKHAKTSADMKDN